MPGIRAAQNPGAPDWGKTPRRYLRAACNASTVGSATRTVSSIQHHDRVDFELHATRQRRYLDGRTRRERRTEVLGHYRVDLREVPEIGEKQAGPDDMVE